MITHAILVFLAIVIMYNIPQSLFLIILVLILIIFILLIIIFFLRLIRPLYLHKPRQESLQSTTFEGVITVLLPGLPFSHALVNRGKIHHGTS